MISKFLSAFVMILFGQNISAQVAIIPEPVSLVSKAGQFKPGNQINISVNTNNADAQRIAGMLQRKLANTGLNSSLSADAGTATDQAIAE